MNLWKIRNYLTSEFVKGLLTVQAAKTAGFMGAISFYSSLSLKVTRGNGMVEDLGVVSHRVVTTEFVKSIAAALDGNTDSDAKTRFPNFKYHGFGTNATSTAVAVGNVTLDTEITDGTPERGTGTQVDNGYGTYTSVGTVTFAGTHAITEHGLFDAVYDADPDNYELMDRHTFTAIGVDPGDSIQATYTLTCTAGG